MDRPLPSEIQRRRWLRRGAQIVATLVVLVSILVWLPGWIRPTVSRARLRTAVVTSGPIDSVVTASGTVVPDVERVLASPLDARVLRILARPGAALKRGDPVVELDVSESRLALDKVVKDGRVKENLQEQTKLTLGKSLTDLDGRIASKQLALESARAKFDADQELLRQGLVSREALRLSELAVRQIDIELQQLRAERSSAERLTSVQLAGLALERESLAREAADKRRLLDLATTKSDRDGVLTWAVSEEGAVVRKGDIIARLADLSSFRVDATVSDVHTGRVRAGLPVLARIDDRTTLDGSIVQIYPTVENGVMRFVAALANRAHPRLRPNLRVDVFVVIDRKPRTLKVTRGPFANGPGAQQAFVVRGDRALRTPVVLGASSFDEIEIVSGASEGDTILISDMRDYLHLKELRLR